MTHFSIKYTNYIFFASHVFLASWANSYSFTDTNLLPQWYCFAGITLLWSIVFFSSWRNVKFRLSAFSVALLVFLSYIFIHSLLSGLINANLLTIPCVIVLFLIFQSSDNCDFEIYKHIVVIIALLQACYGLLQFFDLLPNDTQFPITGRFDNPAGFSACLIVSLPFCLSLCGVKSRRGIFSVICAIFIIGALVLSESRAGMICVAIMLFAGLFHKVLKPKQIITVCIIIGIGAGLLLGFCYKQDSSLGRLSIWGNTIEMIKDAPVLGHGNGAFRAKYMAYQADFFAGDPTHKYADLADNVAQPFNEYLFLAVEHGAVGVMLFLITLIILLLRQKQLSPFLISLIGLGCLALFSYPLQYSYVLVIIALCCGYLASQYDSSRVVQVTALGKFLIVTMSSTMLFLLCKDISFEHRWAQIVTSPNPSAAKYSTLYKSWNGDPLFLYNYGAYLNICGLHAESNEIMLECCKYLNDYDVQMLIASNYVALADWTNAEKRYVLASQMCPVRFMPLYQLAKLYETIGDCGKLCEYAKQIIDKPIKIESTSVYRIKMDMREKLQSL